METSKTINRGSFTVVPKKPYWDWNNRINPDMQISGEELDEFESYLIGMDWMAADEAVDMYWEKIMEKQLFIVTPDREEWPPHRSRELFEEWFDYYIGAEVTDLEDEPLEII